MNLSELKEPLGERFAELEQYVNDLTGQRDAARKESREKRVAIQAEVERLTALKAALLEKLGLDSEEQLEGLPAQLKGQAEAAKQFETKVKRLEREVGEREKALAELTAKHRQTVLSAELGKALNAYEFIDRDVIETYLLNKLTWEDDQARYQDEKGTLVPLAEGVTHLATSKPHLLKQPGARGSGYNPGARGGEVVNPWAKDRFNLTEQLRLADENPTLAAQLKTAAGVV